MSNVKAWPLIFLLSLQQQIRSGYMAYLTSATLKLPSVTPYTDEPLCDIT